MKHATLRKIWMALCLTTILSLVTISNMSRAQLALAAPELKPNAQSGTQPFSGQFGIDNVNRVSTLGGYEVLDDARAQQAQALGSSWTRTTLYWYDLEPFNGEEWIALLDGNAAGVRTYGRRNVRCRQLCNCHIYGHKQKRSSCATGAI